ncbi:MAG: phage tail assembly chaperone [Brucellaceae bacterium]|nr:phage tail assembly chaperone [Notoacmeibacter sp.]MCC0026359.1 phage tail assembly chaperone [Brucellaceae bacterium]
MRLGLTLLRLPPDAFWAMTPLELAACLPPRATPGGCSRAGLEALMHRFPDT